ncbi:MAG: ImmA/IrrE family metallo-endopeptidase [Xanthobacteraceae bacterium]|nr:ImmA/IrrE family metallo-endopeptidase [Xanthobacteraceae bacterium]
MLRLDDEGIERIARQLRIKLGIDDQLRPDMMTVIVKLKEHGIIKNYVRVPDEQMPDDKACYDSDDKLLYIRESTFCAANALYSHAHTDAERQHARFTIAHEIGHVALKHEGLHFRGKSSDAAKRIPSKVRWHERDAERFAAAFLAPAHLA